MIAARAVAGFTAHVPLGHVFRGNVIIDRMAPVAERTGRPLHVVGRIEGNPPVGVRRHVIREPAMMGDVPLRLERKIIIAPARKIALLPAAAIDEGDIVLREGEERIGFREIGDDRIGMRARVAHDIGHARLLPARVNLLMAGLARRRADIVRAGLDRQRFRRLRRRWGQVAQEKNDLPDLLIGEIPGGHRRVANAVMHEGEYLPVGEDRESLPKRGRARIDVRADRRPAAAVEAVADRAILLEERRAGREAGLIGLQRIDAISLLRRDAVHEQPGGDGDFDRRRLRSGA